MTRLLFGKGFEFHESRQQELREALIQGKRALSTHAFAWGEPTWLGRIIRWALFTKVNNVTAASQGVISLIK